MPQVRTRTPQQRRTSRNPHEEAFSIDQKELLFTLQQHWRVITPVWAFLPVVFLTTRLLSGLLAYSIAFWAFSIVFFGAFFFLAYRTYELVTEGRIPLAHWVMVVWGPWMPLAILSNAIIGLIAD